MNFLRKQMKWVMAIIVVAFLLSTFLMYEGRGTRRTPERNADGTMSDYEVAQINGRPLMRSELEQRLRNYLSTYSSRSVASIDMPSIYQAVLDQAVLESQFSKEIEESGIRISDSDAEQAMKNYADTYFPTRETFYQALAQSGVKVEDYKRMLARQMAVEQLINNAVGNVEISEDQAVEFYDTMKNLIYSKPEGFMVHMADFNTSADAENFRAKLVAGESWDVIVSNDELTSSDVINVTTEAVFVPSSALKSGTLTVLDSLDIGQPTPVFNVSSFDFAVGLKTKHVDESVTPYDEVSEDIRLLLTQQEQRKRMTEYENSLKSKAKLVIYDTELFTSTAVSNDESMPEFILDEMLSGDEAKTEKSAAEAEKTPEETVKSEEVKPVEKSKSEDVKAEKPVAAEAEKTHEETVKSEEVKPVEKAKSEDVKAEKTAAAEAEKTHEKNVKSEEVKPAEKAKSEEVKAEKTAAAESEKTHEKNVKSEEVKPVEKAKSEEVKAEKTAAAEAEKTPEETVKSEEVKPAEEAKSEDVSSKKAAEKIKAVTELIEKKVEDTAKQ